jgi:O-succinylbenzoic acid--CoA ligase
MSSSLSALAAAAEPGVGARVALVGDGETLRFEALAARVRRVAAALAGAGVGLGSRVVLVAHARVETVVALLALAELGATAVPVHPRLTTPEADALARDAAADLRLRDLDTEALEELASSACACLGGARLDDGLPRAHEPAAPFAMVQTSGSTGHPKLAVLSRGAIAAAASVSTARLGFREDDRWLLAMPLAHVGGLSIVTRCLAARRTIVLEPRFDPAAVLAAIARERVTLLSVVPTMLAALLDADRAGVLASLRVVLVGGAHTPRALGEECARRRVRALASYGLTELASQVTTQPPRDPRVALAGSGLPLPGVVVRVARADGAEAASGEVGRILAGGPTRMSGYFRGRGAPLDAPFDGAGLFDTGDLGAFDDDGHLHVDGRRADLVVTGGENVSPAEVERALEACPGVGRALVFGVPDERWGEIVACALVPADPSSFDPSRVARELAAGLAPHKRPRRACVVDALPLSAAGKPDRRGAAERLAAVLRPWPQP